ncbi:MAG: hypothetical protein WBA74_24965 [Cyclobacteriaceae bacterium]
MSTIYNIKLNMVSDWVKYSEDEMERLIRVALKEALARENIRQAGNMTVKEDKYGGTKPTL